MRKKLIAVIAVVALSLPLFACSSEAKTELTKYTIDATLSADNILTASVTCDYVNNTDVPLKELWFHLYPNAYREGAKYSPVPANRITEAYPSGKSYSVMSVDGVTVNGKAKEVTVSGEDENILVVALNGTLDP